MSTEYRLLFDDDVYADMVQDSFNLSRWMNMDRVLARATIIPRSKKKLDELCRKGAVLIGDTLTMRMTGGDGVTIDFSATIVAFDTQSSPMMRTVGQAGGNLWSCVGPTQFLKTMVREHPNITLSSRKTWETTFVTRNNQELGSLYIFRQSLELWEHELEKWGCNGLGEELGDKHTDLRV